MLLKISLLLFTIGCGNSGNNRNQKEQNKKDREVKDLKQERINKAVSQFNSELFSDSFDDKNLESLQNLIEEIGIFELDDHYSRTGKYNLLTSSLCYKKFEIVRILLDILSKEKNKEKVSKFLNYQIKGIEDKAIHLSITIRNRALMEKITENLIELGLNINSKGNNGETPLHVAVSEVDKNLILFLLSKGADKTIKNNDNLTPLEQAKKISLNGYYGSDLKDIIDLLENN